MRTVEQFSRGRTNGFTSAFLSGFAILILLALAACKNTPVEPVRMLDNGGAVVFAGDSSRQGQEVFLKYGLMDSGTIWGHCAYLGHDFGAITSDDGAPPPG